MTSRTRDEMPSDLWRWSATSLRDAMRRGDVSATEVATAHLERCDDVNGRINALISVSAEEALATARELDARPQADRTALLHGVPVSIKDNTDQAGHATTCGIVEGAGNVAEEDASPVAALRSSGAVFVGRSNLPAWGLRWFSENELFGRTLNPWTADHTPGGSSGGAAAAVAAGIVPIAHANDIGGSIRYPAAVCGVTGIRPTAGRVPKWSAPSLVSHAPSIAETVMAVEGPIARHVEDLRIALRAMSVHDPRDPASLPIGYQDEPALPPGTKVGVVREIPGVETCQENLRAVDDAARWLEEAGYRTVEVNIPEILEAHRLWLLLLFEELRLGAAEMVALGGADLRQAMEYNFAVEDAAWGPNATLETFLRGHTRRNEILSVMETRFTDVSLLLTPFSAARAPEHGADFASLERASQLLWAQWPMTFVPCLGLPAATVPTGVAGGLPGSVQIIGGRFRESWILDAAQAIEDRAGVITPVDPVHVR
ncbi:amidase [Lentzea aerocolonigenes]|uniref:amidase n=1 Tax=Lentzea aerocolonigenes TaxID=68170 RepID=UPI00068B361D|nr:amidase [Lentzea aerocolonigenes]MCP2243981.1 amidase [Lentzea aerocolonigenes]